MATAGSVVIDLIARTGSFITDTDRATKAAQKNFKAMQKQAEESAAKISRAFTGILSGALFGVSAGAIFGKFIEETKNAQNEQAQLAAALKATGSAAGYTIGQLNSMASEFSGKSVFSEGDINRAQTRLLSYTGIVGEQFPKALQATIDTAQRMGMTVEQAAETVGRALDIPSQGLASLSKQGFRFTDDQKKLVAQLEATGQTAKAQQIILDALESSYGGAAEAARNTLGGALQALQNQIDDLMTGDDGSVNGLTGAVNDLTDSLGSEETKRAFSSFLEGMAKIATKAVEMAAAFATVSDKAGGFINALSAFSAGDNLFGVFRDDAGNIQAATKELSDLAAMQDRLNSGAAKWNDYNQDSLDAAKKAAQARLTYYTGQQNQREKDVFAAYKDIGETGAGAVTLPAVRVTGSAPTTGGKAQVDQGQKLIDQLQKQVDLTGELTERQKLQIQIQQGYVTFQTQTQQDSALALADTLDFIKQQNEAYEETQKTLKDLAKVNQDTTDEMGQFAIQAARNIQSSLGDGLYDILSGNFDNIGQSFANTILRMVADAQAANLAKVLFGDYDKSGQIGGLIGQAFGSYFGGSTISGGSNAATTDAIGSFDGLSYAGYADGGYTGAGGRNDVAGVVHAGEYVINAQSTRKLGMGFLSRLNGYADGGYVGNPPSSSGGSPNVAVEITNNGTPQQVASSNVRFDPDRMVIQVVLNDIRRNGKIAQAIKGVPA